MKYHYLLIHVMPHFITAISDQKISLKENNDLLPNLG